MGTLGILVTKLVQEQEYFLKMAKAGHSQGIDCYLFLPTAIDPIQKIAKGKRYCPISNDWIDELFSIPALIYDRCFYENETVFKENSLFVSWLKSQSDVDFLGHGLPNKWVVFNTLKTDHIIRSFLPITELVTDSNQVFSMLKTENSVLLKPISGSQGKGIFVLTKGSDHFFLIAKKEGQPYYKQLSEKQTKHLLFKLVTRYKYLLQPFLSLTNKENRPFDLRVFLQKDDKGQWREIGRGIRHGKVGDFTSNLGTGGSVVPYEQWFQSLTTENQTTLQENVNKLLIRIPKVLEKVHHLFELGLDFGFDQKGRLWLLEVNSKPGRKVVTTCFPGKETFLAEATIDYCLFINGSSLVDRTRAR